MILLCMFVLLLVVVLAVFCNKNTEPDAHLSVNYLKGRGDVCNEFKKEFEYEGVPKLDLNDPNARACQLLAGKVAPMGCTLYRMAAAIAYAADQYGIKMEVTKDPCPMPKKEVA